MHIRAWRDRDLDNDYFVPSFVLYSFTYECHNNAPAVHGRNLGASNADYGHSSAILARAQKRLVSLGSGSVVGLMHLSLDLSNRSAAGLRFNWAPTQDLSMPPISNGHVRELGDYILQG